MILTILIPTVAERREQCSNLVHFIQNIIDLHDFQGIAEVVTCVDNKEMTIGEKRELLYYCSSGLYSWQVDDDDCIAPEAIALIVDAALLKPDCITFQEKCIIDGVESHSNFSLMYHDWAENFDGWDHVRTPFFKTPILTSIARRVPVPHIRFGEDHEWARAIRPLLTSEVHIPEFLYYYTHTSSPFNERYGITKD